MAPHKRGALSDMVDASALKGIGAESAHQSRERSTEATMDATSGTPTGDTSSTAVLEQKAATDKEDGIHEVS